MLASQVKSELDQINDKIDRICNYIDLTKTKDKKVTPFKEANPSGCKPKKFRSQQAQSKCSASKPNTIGIDLRRNLSSATKQGTSVSNRSISKTSIKTNPKWPN